VIVGLTVGCWDRWHRGHAAHVDRCVSRCGLLIVGVMSDEWMRGAKGVPDPLPQAARIDAIRRRYPATVLPVPLDVPDLSAYAPVVRLLFVGEDQWWWKLGCNAGLPEPTVIPRTPGISSTLIREGRA
jgi:nicotinamide mononucleotide adenylyltransferase